MKKLLLTLSFFFTSFCFPKVFIFDLGNTLLEADYFTASRFLGITDCVIYNYHHSAAYLQNKVIETLHQIKPYQENSEIEVRLDNGQPCPLFLLEWFKGNFEATDIEQFINDYLMHLHENKWFHSDREYRLVANTIKMMFTPEQLACSMKPIKKMKKLLKKLSKITDEHGKPLHQFYIISNWDKESFALLYARQKDFFKFFEPENIIISGEIGLVKPDPAIFEQVLDTFNLDPADCLFIDDQIENITAARTCGIESFHYNKNHHKTLENKLLKEELL